MVGPILYDGTGLPHRRRYAPRPAPEPVAGGPVLAGVDLAEVNNEAIEPETVLIPAPTTVEVTFSSVSLETVALATGFSVEELGELGAVEVESPAEDAQEPDQAPESEPEAEPAADEATSPVSDDKSTTEDAGAATLAALGL